MHKEANVPGTHMLHDINTTWRNLWVFGATATGTETIVPHKGKRAGPLRQFIPRKPHSTGVKLYVVVDACTPSERTCFCTPAQKRRNSWAARGWRGITTLAPLYIGGGIHCTREPPLWHILILVATMWPYKWPIGKSLFSCCANRTK